MSLKMLSGWPRMKSTKNQITQTDTLFRIAKRMSNEFSDPFLLDRNNHNTLLLSPSSPKPVEISEQKQRFLQIHQWYVFNTRWRNQSKSCMIWPFNKIYIAVFIMAYLVLWLISIFEKSFDSEVVTFPKGIHLLTDGHAKSKVLSTGRWCPHRDTKPPWRFQSCRRVQALVASAAWGSQ